MRNQIRSVTDFLELVVLPDVADFKQDAGDLRRAFHACISLTALRERYHKERTNGVHFSAFCDQLHRECPAVKQIADVANNAKHFPPDRSPTLDVGVSVRDSGWDDALWDVSEWDRETEDSTLVYEPRVDTKIWLVEAVIDASAFWRRKLGQL